MTEPPVQAHGPGASEPLGPQGSGGTQGALPLDVRTGDTGVDAAVAALAELDSLAVTDHPQVFEQVHHGLQDALVDLDRD